ncbi:AAA family ATPase [Marinobacter sp. TBZ242]|uniref:AAA family ATPase n=1 Tax=Marinobacter azerbaijanicus TaxID=3050455 RepID=A0ABT7I830_9GAMM|nr:AAA family ATPase [Marinobacter sp. TBZ242]MDL0430311.1 AAA family ATPase [Marinobacter sp. TBZ242]
MNISIEIKNVQHIRALNFTADLSKNRLICLVGKNSTGKTTLVRAFKNLYSADTFKKTASPYIFSQQSEITYKVGNDSYEFKFNPKIKLLDTKDLIPKEIKNSIYVELPLPHGERFNHFQKLANIDDELRSKIATRTFKTPHTIIKFLGNIYQSDRFKNLKCAQIKGDNYYFILLEDDYYIREDYLSSGEYFVINLFKAIEKNKKCIVIDEIDLSLDASAQVNLINELREFCQSQRVNIIFTTHSLALMKTLRAEELHFVSEANGNITSSPKSYNYIKSLLFGFRGWDRYILTEDDVLKNYIEYITSLIRPSPFFKYKIIYIGGSANVTDLMKRNKKDNFLSSPENVISILDGDQKHRRHVRSERQAFCIPFESIEKDLFEHYESNCPDIPRIDLGDVADSKKAKKLYKRLILKKLMTEVEIFEFLNKSREREVGELKRMLTSFLR